MDEFGRYAMIFICLIGILVIFYAFLQWAGVAIPSIVIYVFWVVVVVVLCIGAIKLIMRMMRS